MLAHRLETLENRAMLSTVTLLSGMPAPDPDAVIEIEPFNSWGGEGEPGVDQSLPEEDVGQGAQSNAARPRPNPTISQVGEVVADFDDDMYSFQRGVDDATYDAADALWNGAVAIVSPTWLNSSHDRSDARGDGRVRANFIEHVTPSYRDLHL